MPLIGLQPNYYNYWSSGATLNALHVILFNLHCGPLKDSFSFHFTNEETKIREVTPFTQARAVGGEVEI